MTFRALCLGGFIRRPEGVLNRKAAATGMVKMDVGLERL